MSRCDMQGFATDRELSDLYFELSLKSEDERKSIAFALFVPSEGMMNGERAYKYLKEKYFS